MWLESRDVGKVNLTVFRDLMAGGGAERESRARKQVSGLAPEQFWGHGRYPKEAGLQRTGTSALWAMRVVYAPKGSRTMVQKSRRDAGAGGQLSVPRQRVLEAISMDGLLQGAHNRTLRNPMVHGANGEACTGN